MIWIALFITGVLLIFTMTMLLNIITFPRLGREQPTPDAPFVSVLIPARNEEAVIEQTIRKHLASDYPHFELIVMNDKSDDATGDIARRIAATDSRLRVIEGTAIPAGWSGKSWACHNLGLAARGEILVFTDADVQWQPTALPQVIAQMERTNVGMFTVWPTQETVTMSERLTVPLMALVILGYLPIVMVHYSRLAMFSAANGQCMVWRRDVYNKIGGHTVVANNVLDDVTLARAAKQAGYTIRMADGTGLIRTRMYDNWRTVRDGFAKNILAGYGNSVFALLVATIFHWLVFLFPLVMLFTAEYRLWGALLLGLGVGIRALSAAFTRQRLIDALLMPVSVLLMTVIAAQSIIWHFTGGPRWKGRILSKQRQGDTWQQNRVSSSARGSAD